MRELASCGGKHAGACTAWTHRYRRDEPVVDVEIRREIEVVS